MMYIKMGFMRLKPDIQVELIPLLFQTIPNRSISHQELLMGLIVYALQYVKIIPNMNDNIVKYGLTDQPIIRNLFLNFLLNVILLPYKFVSKKNSILILSITKNHYLDSMKQNLEIPQLASKDHTSNHLKHLLMKYFFQQWMMHQLKKLKYLNNHIHA